MRLNKIHLGYKYEVICDCGRRMFPHKGIPPAYWCKKCDKAITYADVERMK